MPWKMISLLVALIVAALFVGFNLDNRCDVSLMVYTFRNVPVCVSLLIAFAVGLAASVPFYLEASRKNRKKSATAASRTDAAGSRSAGSAKSKKNAWAPGATSARKGARDVPPSDEESDW